MSLSAHCTEPQATREEPCRAEGRMEKDLRHFVLQAENRNALRWRFSDAGAAMDMAEFVIRQLSLLPEGTEQLPVSVLAITLINKDEAVPEQ